MACSFFMPSFIFLSISFLNSINWLATTALRTLMADEQLADDPTARNSNRFPVNAKGEVRFRSVLSINTSGIWEIPSFILRSSSIVMSSSSELSSILSSTDESCEPRNTEIMAGGASLAPRRCAFCADMMDALSKLLCLYTAMSVLMRNVTNRRFSFAVLPGVKSPTPVSVPSDQLLCLPDPFTPANGFSCNNNLKLCLVAILCISDMINRFWSTARFVSP